MTDAVLELDTIHKNVDGDLALDSNVVPLHHRYDSQSLEEFLLDDDIGPLTGLAKRFADYDLIDELDNFSDATISSKIAYGMLVCYLLRGDKDGARALINRPNNSVSIDEAMKINKYISNPNPNIQHRFEKLIYEYADLRKEEKNLKRDRRVQDTLRQLVIESKCEKNHKDELLEDGDEQHYNNFCRLSGVYLAEGKINEAQNYLERLSTPKLRIYDDEGHIAAVVEYMRNGGAQTLAEKAKFDVGKNHYWWQDRFGTEKHPGRYRKAVENYVFELSTIFAGAITAGTITLASDKLIGEYKNVALVGCGVAIIGLSALSFVGYGMYKYSKRIAKRWHEYKPAHIL